MTSSSTRCLYPFMSLMVAPGGNARLCSSSLHSLGDLGEKTLDEIWNGPEMRGLRADLNAGRKPKPCLTCFRAEERGLPSKRRKFLESRLRVYGEEGCREILKAAPRIRHLDLSFSNLCNLTCATCSSVYSTAWIAHDRSAEELGLDFRGLSEEDLKPKRLPEERIQEILDVHLPDLRTLIIKGGEPLLDPGCLRFLKALAESPKKPNDLIVSVQTNGTHLTEEARKLLVAIGAEVAFSIDGLDETYRWIRGGDFQRVLGNLRALGHESGSHRIMVDFTSSAFNIAHLPDFVRFMVGLRREIPRLAVCFVGAWANQDYLSPRLLPLGDRLEILRELESLETGGLLQGLPALKKTLESAQLGEKSVEKLRRWTEFCNRRRGFAIESLHPVLAPLLRGSHFGQAAESSG